MNTPMEKNPLDPLNSVYTGSAHLYNNTHEEEMCINNLDEDLKEGGCYQGEEEPSDD